jgi:WD40 repeat protein
MVRYSRGSTRRERCVVPDVFVSYSRRDVAFVRRLVESIEERGKRVWLDAEGIADGEVFPQAIRSAIEQSDAFVFVITPAAVQSSFCDLEVDYARELNKRIVPVLRDPVRDSELPPEIRDRNWIPFTDDDEFDPGLGRLITALDNDLDAAKAHTRWLVKALEWDAEGRDRSFLLRGAELRAAERWLASRPDDADPAPTALQRDYLLASRTAAGRRQRILMGASVAVAAVSIGLLIFALISRGQAISAQAVAKSRALAAESENQIAVDPELSILLGMQAVRASPTPDALFALRAAIDASPLRRTLLTPAQVGCQLQDGSSLAYNPSVGLAEALCGGTPGPGRPPPRGRVVVFNPGDGHVVMQTRLGLGALPAVAFSPAGSTLAAAGVGGRVLLLDAHTGAIRGSLGASPFGAGGAPRGPVVFPHAVKFSPDGSQLIVLDSQAKLWSLRGRASVVLEGSAVPGPNAPQLLDAAFVDGGRAVVVVGSNGARVCDTRTGSLLRDLSVSGVGALAVSPDGSELAVGSMPPGQVGAVATVWSTRTWHPTATVAVFAGRIVNSLAFSPDGKDLAIGVSDGSAGLWSVRTHDQLAAYLGSTSPVTSIAFMPDRGELATASVDGTTNVWRASGPELVSIDAGTAVDGVRLSGARLTAALEPNVVRSWLLPGLVPQGHIASEDPHPGGVFVSADGTVSVEPQYEPSVGAFTGFLVHDATTGRLIGKLVVPPLFTLSGFGVSADGRKVLLLGAQSQEIADVTRRQVVHLKATAGSSVRGIQGCQWFTGAISGDDRLAAGADQCGRVTIWDARSGAQLERVSVSGLIPDIAFSPDGRQLAAASGNSTITIWDVDTGQVAHVLHGHTLGVNALAYSPNGDLLASVGLDDTLRVWDTSSGRLLRVWRDPASLTRVAFSSDGQRIVTADTQGTIRIWDACTACENPSALIAIGQSSVTRQLTPLERATFLAGF